MRKAVLYCRVDSPVRESTESAIENQRRQLERYAKNPGMEIVGVFEDAGLAGTTLNRPGLQAMMNEVEAGNADTVLTFNRSRLFRGSMPEKLRQLPAKIITTNEPSLER